MMLNILILQNDEPKALYEVSGNNHKSAVNLAIELLNKSGLKFNLEDAKDYLEMDGYYIIPFKNFGVYIITSETFVNH